MEILILALFTAIGKLIILFKFFPPKKVLYFEKWIDLAACVGLPIMLYGTFSGMILALFSGLFLSIMLFVSRIIIGTEQPEFLKSKASKALK
jgi:hypothetical protein